MGKHIKMTHPRTNKGYHHSKTFPSRQDLSHKRIEEYENELSMCVTLA
jgi:hypothetical protein